MSNVTLGLSYKAKEADNLRRKARDAGMSISGYLKEIIKRVLERE